MLNFTILSFQLIVYILVKSISLQLPAHLYLIFNILFVYYNVRLCFTIYYLYNECYQL